MAVVCCVTFHYYEIRRCDYYYYYYSVINISCQNGFNEDPRISSYLVLHEVACMHMPRAEMRHQKSLEVEFSRHLHRTIGSLHPVYIAVADARGGGYSCHHECFLLSHRAKIPCQNVPISCPKLEISV